MFCSGCFCLHSSCQTNTTQQNQICYIGIVLCGTAAPSFVAMGKETPYYLSLQKSFLDLLLIIVSHSVVRFFVCLCASSERKMNAFLRQNTVFFIVKYLHLDCSSGNNNNTDKPVDVHVGKKKTGNDLQLMIISNGNKKHECSYSCMKYAAMCFEERMFRDRNTKKTKKKDNRISAF